MNDINLNAFGIEGTHTLDTISSIPDSTFPTLNNSSQLEYDIDTNTDTHINSFGRRWSKHSQSENILVSPRSNTHLFLKEIISHGSYGDIRIAERVKHNKTSFVLVKSPRLTEMNLKIEAIIQHIARNCLMTKKMEWAIPAIYDIYQYKKSISYTMEHIIGVYLHDWFLHTKEPDKDFYRILLQISLILFILQKNLDLDHRDLKANNLYLRTEETVIQFKQELITYEMYCPFKLTLLDFGFACIGTKIHLGSDVLPRLDPCPKEGRDLFHLLVSFLSTESIYTRLSPSTLEHIHTLLGNKYYTMATKWKAENWVHLLTSKSDFTLKTLSPRYVLNDIIKTHPELFTTKENKEK